MSQAKPVETETDDVETAVEEAIGLLRRRRQAGRVRVDPRAADVRSGSRADRVGGLRAEATVTVTAKLKPGVFPMSEFGDGLTTAERTLRTAVMLALDEVDEATARAFSDRHHPVAVDRERALREIADLVMRSAMLRGGSRSGGDGHNVSMRR